jgi:hypothetical protein
VVIPQLINWLCDMSIITRCRGDGGADTQYQIAPSIRHALSLMDADD